MSTEQGGLNDEGGCAMDWSWLRGERVSTVANALDALTVTFESGLVFTVRALLWKGKPFLAFEPHQRPPEPL